MKTKKEKRHIEINKNRFTTKVVSISEHLHHTREQHWFVTNEILRLLDNFDKDNEGYRILVKWDVIPEMTFCIIPPIKPEAMIEFHLVDNKVTPFGPEKDHELTPGLVVKLNEWFAKGSIEAIDDILRPDAPRTARIIH